CCRPGRDEAYPRPPAARANPRRYNSPGRSALRPSDTRRLAFPTCAPRRCEWRRKPVARPGPRSAPGIVRVLKLAAPYVLLSKKIFLCGPDQFPRPTAASAVTIAANDARGRFRQLAANQSRRASQFVRHRVDRRVQRIAMRIAAAAVVDQRPHPSDANRHFRQAFPPWTPKTIADDHRDVDPKLLLQLPPQPRRGTIRIHRQQHRMPPTIHVRHIHATVGANKSVLRLGDQHVALAPHDSPALAHRQFTDAWVEPEASRPTL